jgi:EAL domain-containing protein (putative c-di-GMP-specific phosphodiesterase class I)
MVGESPIALKNLNHLAEMGVMLSVDDFGTGYSTLKQLQQLPVHEVKIDRSFVSGMTHSRGNQSIIRATIELAKQLGLSVVAEGVESLAELRALASMGCNEVQGYYVSRPMPAADLPGWIETRHSLYSNSREKYFELLMSEKR